MVRMNSVFIVNAHRYPTRRVILPSFAVCLLLIVFVGSRQQALAQDSTPTATVRQFKEKLDAADFQGACKLMAETDQSGPLKLKHYEQMQLSLDGLAKMWRGATFSLGNEQINTDTQPPSATVAVSVTGPNQDVKMKLLKFDSTWYIVDIEIFFK